MFPCQDQDWVKQVFNSITVLGKKLWFVIDSERILIDN